MKNPMKSMVREAKGRARQRVKAQRKDPSAFDRAIAGHVASGHTHVEAGDLAAKEILASDRRHGDGRFAHANPYDRDTQTNAGPEPSPVPPGETAPPPVSASTSVDPIASGLREAMSAPTGFTGVVPGQPANVAAQIAPLHEIAVAIVNGRFTNAQRGNR